MKTKYFRFLYCAQKSCMVHFGELTDTLTKEHFSFVYVSGGQMRADAAESGKCLFLCPAQVDLVVLGDANEKTDAVLQGILKESEVKLLVLPESEYCWGANIQDAKKQIYLSSESDGVCCTDGVMDTEAAQSVKSLLLTAAGWKFFIRNYDGESLVMAHSLDGNPEAFHGIEGEKEADQPWENPFEDCVMNVKVLDTDERCCYEMAPDSYACALGCALRKDSDVCRYQRGRNGKAYLTGALLMAGRNPGDYWGKLEGELGAWIEEMRFFLLPMTCTKEERQEKITGENRKSTETYFRHLGRTYKRYYISEKEHADETMIKELCSSGLYQIPALLGNGEGICCSGLLKYANKEQTDK